jgi:hypothetical protein
MLALRGKSQVGNMLHVVIGPETELFSDIHGAAVLDVTPLLYGMDGEQHVFLTLTHCRTEQITAQRMAGAGIPHISSFGPTAPDGEGESGASPEAFVGTEQVPTANTAQKAPGKKVPGTKHNVKAKCEYCTEELDLLPIPGFHICRVCAQIELGRLKQAKSDDTEGKNDGTPTV